jgi:hypothetical protein
MPDNLLAAIRSWGLGEPLPDIGAAAAQSYSHDCMPEETCKIAMAEEQARARHAVSDDSVSG